MFSIMPGLHRFPQGTFGSLQDLMHPMDYRQRDTLMFACSEQGAAPDNVSFAEPGRFTILQHIGACIPSRTECEQNTEFAFDQVEALFDRDDYRHVIVCGHLKCGVIHSWLQPALAGASDIGNFRRRFEKGARDLVDKNYQPDSGVERRALMICEHVLCQIENMLTHSFVMDRVLAGSTAFHGWVVDDDTARVYGYDPDKLAFVPI